ncbi:MAG: GntR family transcriptional regulator, partial [Armatimonadetes bacterium]|nr:GntR family transcriptional regulator [Armatimonadota bacterium]
MGLREGSLFSRKDGERAAYSEIKQRIIDGRLPLGSRLVLRNLAQELGVSLIPVVEAVRMLERDGLVANVRSRGPGRGAQVRTWTRDEIVDLFKIRASLEALAADFCAERATDDEIAAVLTANEMFKDSTERHDSEMHIQADVEFHKAVVRGAHCPD